MFQNSFIFFDTIFSIHLKGGNNAGHTVSDGTTTFFFHVIPRYSSR